MSRFSCFGSVQPVAAHFYASHVFISVETAARFYLPFGVELCITGHHADSAVAKAIAACPDSGDADADDSICQFQYNDRRWFSQIVGISAHSTGSITESGCDCGARWCHRLCDPTSFLD